MRKAVKKLESGKSVFRLDDGTPLTVSIQIDKNLGEAEVDFSETKTGHKFNFNTPLAVTKAATAYVFHTLLQENISLRKIIDPMENNSCSC